MDEEEWTLQVLLSLPKRSGRTSHVNTFFSTRALLFCGVKKGLG